MKRTMLTGRAESTKVQQALPSSLSSSFKFGARSASRLRALPLINQCRKRRRFSSRTCGEPVALQLSDLRRRSCARSSLDSKEARDLGARVSFPPATTCSPLRLSSHSRWILSLLPRTPSSSATASPSPSTTKTASSSTPKRIASSRGSRNGITTSRSLGRRLESSSSGRFKVEEIRDSFYGEMDGPSRS